VCFREREKGNPFNVPLLGGSGQDVIQELDYPKVIQMIGTDSLIDCLHTSFGRIKLRRSLRV
jgi:hypothetical protein